MELVYPDPGLIIWTLLTFLLVLFLLKKFAWGPIMNALTQRESFIEDSLKAAENAKKEMANLKAENERLIDQAKIERDKIIKEANAAARQIVDEANAEASKEAKKRIEEARLAINTEKQAALAEVKNQVAELSVQIAEKLMRQQLNNEAAQKALVQDYIKDLTIKVH